MIISFYDAKEKTWMGLPLYITDNLHQNGLKAPAGFSNSSVFNY